MFRNEDGVGAAIKNSGLDRDELYVTTKLNNGFHEPASARSALETSLEQLGLDHVDLFLIHWPLPTLYDGDYTSAWEALIKFREEGLTTSIGVSMKVREGGRVINAVVLLATGVNGDGHREVLGMRVATAETGAAWNEFFADLVARGLTGVRLVTSDAHKGLAAGRSWRTCRGRPLVAPSGSGRREATSACRRPHRSC